MGFIEQLKVTRDAAIPERRALWEQCVINSVHSFVEEAKTGALKAAKNCDSSYTSKRLSVDDLAPESSLEDSNSEGFYVNNFITETVRRIAEKNDFYVETFGGMDHRGYTSFRLNIRW